MRWKTIRQVEELPFPPPMEEERKRELEALLTQHIVQTKLDIYQIEHSRGEYETQSDLAFDRILLTGLRLKSRRLCAALHRLIYLENYGQCLLCSEPIDVRKLSAFPFLVRCDNCLNQKQRQFELLQRARQQDVFLRSTLPFYR